jgi:hypothetical protein
MVEFTDNIQRPYTILKKDEVLLQPAMHDCVGRRAFEIDCDGNLTHIVWCRTQFPKGFTMRVLKRINQLGTLQSVADLPPLSACLHRSHNRQDINEWVRQAKIKFGRQMLKKTVVSTSSGVVGDASSAGHIFIPAEVLHEAFAIFSNRRMQIPTSDGLICASQMTEASRQLFDNEAERSMSLRNIMTQLFGDFHTDVDPSDMMLNYKRNKKPDWWIGDWANPKKVGIREPLQVLVEVKVEQGHGNPDVQNIMYYAYHVSTLAALSDCSVFPTLLISTDGTYFRLQAAVFLHSVIVVPLVEHNLLAISCETELAKSLDAMKACMAHIRTSPTAQCCKPLAQSQLIFPWMTEIECEQSSYKFQYLGGIVRGVFHVRYNDRFGVVKFTNRYNIKVHTILANEGLAPALICHQTISEGWIAVLMEDARQDGFVVLRDIVKTTPFVANKITEAVDKVHAAGVILADLRAPNILVHPDTFSVMFIDFDWSGLQGDSWPPVSKNPNLKWPPASDPGQLLTAAQDIFMLAQIIN